MSLIFPTLDEMLRARGVRQREDGSFAEDSYDFGVWWRDPSGGVYRLTWIGDRLRETEAGELYLIRLAPRLGPVELLCIVAPDPVRPSDRIDAIIEGWADVCGTPSSTLWVFDRVAEALEAGWATSPTVEAAEPVCDRCRLATSVWTGSVFNDDRLCISCSNLETQRDGYDAAVRQREWEAAIHRGPARTLRR